jgi:outer membrane protein OmpA-like peptidoglycan-associated protein
MVNTVKSWMKLLPGCFLFFLLAGCSAHRDLIVLLPDPDGNVGTIEVTTRGGSRKVDRVGYAIHVKDSDTRPLAPEPIEEKKIARLFGVAISAQPDVSNRYALFTLYFENDTIDLTDHSRKTFPQVIASIRGRQPKEIYVLGHADRVGTELYNVELSSRRADRVRELLISNAVGSDALVVSFHGEAKPLVQTEDEVAEPLNRRVEIIVR